MHVAQLTREQVIQLYPILGEAFPEDELRPLSRMLEAFDHGTYDCFGLMDGTGLVGYAFFVRTDGHLLFDYFSTLPAFRNRGLGATFLRLLAPFFQQADSVIAEVENPAYAENAADRELQTRRLAFYLRNGFVDTGVEVLVFDVHYLLLLVSNQKPWSPDTVRAQYRSHYQAMLLPEVYRERVQIAEV